MSQESMGEATDQLAEAVKGNDPAGETSVYTDETRPLDETRALSPKLKRYLLNNSG
jgi:hypothetical protein